MTEKIKDKKMITEVFVDGARKGWAIGVSNIIPNVLMAFVIIHALRISGLLDLIGKLFGPVMGIFGLPGEAATVLLGSWMSMGGGVGVAVSLFNEGLLNGVHVSILTPAIFLMGAQIQYAGRLLGSAEVKGKHYGILFGICILNAIISLFIMRMIVGFF